jgi:hypothetical protein
MFLIMNRVTNKLGFKAVLFANQTIQERGPQPQRSRNLAHNRGLIQVGLNVGKTHCLSLSAQRLGRARPTQRSLHFVDKCHNMTHLCFYLLLPYSHLAENHRFFHAGVGYRNSFPSSTRNSQFSSFLSPGLTSFLVIH